MFHLTTAPNGRVIDGPTEYASLGPGWFDTLEEAQLAEGHQQSFVGRAGAQRPSGLPAVLAPAVREDERVATRLANNAAAKAKAVGGRAGKAAVIVRNKDLDKDSKK